MGTRDRDGDIAPESPMSQNDEDLSDLDNDLQEEMDSCDRLNRNDLTMQDHENDVLAKLKMQVQDLAMQGRLDREELEQFHLKNLVQSHMASAANGQLSNTSTGTLINSPLPLMFPFPHPTNAFLPPLAPQQPSGGGSRSSHSGSSQSPDGSVASPQQWSFEEQFKQVRQLYEINDDPKRKEFLDDLFSFMQKRGTPINRLPIMAKSVLDLYELYNLVISRGGLVEVINKKLWQEIIKGLHLPSSITSAAFTLRTQYMKYLYPYECDKKKLSTPAELQAAIDGNRREGRRSSYGTYSEMIPRSPVISSQQMSPAMTLAAQQQNLINRMNEQQLMSRMNFSNHSSQPSAPIAPLPGELEQRMMEYMKILDRELRSSAAFTQNVNASQACQNANPHIPSPPMLSHTPTSSHSTPAAHPLSAFEISRLALWNMYNNTPAIAQNMDSVPVAPPPPQREALNLADLGNQHSSRSPVSLHDDRVERSRSTTSTPHSSHSSRSIKREPHSEDAIEQSHERRRGVPSPLASPPPKRRVKEKKPSIPEHMEFNSQSSPRCSPPRVSDEAEASVEAHVNVCSNNGNSHEHIDTKLSSSIKITNIDNGSKGEQAITMSMEINGLIYTGVLFAKASRQNGNL